MNTRSIQIKTESSTSKTSSLSQENVCLDKVRRTRRTLCEVIDALERPINIGAFVFRLKSGNNRYQPAFVVLEGDPETALPLPCEPGGPCLRAHLERTGFGQVSHATLNDALVAAKLPIFDWPGVCHFNESFLLPDFARPSVRNILEAGK